MLWFIFTMQIAADAVAWAQETGDVSAIVTVRGIPAVEFASLSRADVDGDGDSDIAVLGMSNNGDVVSAVFRFEGRIVEQLPSGFSRTVAVFSVYDELIVPVLHGSSDWADFDADGRPDLLVSGLARESSGPTSSYDIPTTILYRNLETGLVPQGIPFVGVAHGQVEAVDLDGDGDMDVVISGVSTDGPILEAYMNDGMGRFPDRIRLDSIAATDLLATDIDGDGDPDLLVCGRTVNDMAVFVVYENNGNGGLTGLHVEEAALQFASLSAADIDGDGINDVHVAGGVISPILFRPESFVLAGPGPVPARTVVPSPGRIFAGRTYLADFESDGDPDLLVHGLSNMSLPESEKLALYMNDGGTLRPYLNLRGTTNGDVLWYDYSGVGRRDILITGRQNNAVIILIYEL